MEQLGFYGYFLQEQTGFWALGCLVFLLSIGFLGLPLFVWTIALTATLIGFACPEPLIYGFLAFALVFNIPPVRQLAVSQFVLKLFHALKFIPSISETERTALDAGVVWAEGELFSGKPDFKKLMAEPYPNLTKEEQDFLNGPTERLCEMLDDWEIWEQREIPPVVWDFIKKEKFLGMIIPKEYGGLGFSALAHSEVIMKVSSRSLPAGVTIMVPNSLGPAELLIHYGTEEQRKRLLPKLAIGEEIPCFALTEPGAGSDAGAITAEGILFKGDDGKLYIKLNWNKRWITLAAISTTLGLAFRLKDPGNLLNRGEDVGITCALIPSRTPGVVIGRRHDPLGVPFYNCPTQGKDVVVSVDQIVGGIEGAGHGWKMLMESLAAGRGISLPGQSTGGAKYIARVVSAHATVRKQFGTSIGRFEGIEEPIARIGAYTYLLDAMRKYTLGALDKGIKPPVVTAIAKYNATELSRKIINDGMDIVGGAGISRGPRNTLSHLYIATPIGITVEGANILTRTLIIFGQGAMRAHPFAYKEINAMEKGDVTGFDRAFWGHIGHVVRNLCRCIALSLTRGWLAPSPVGGSVAKYFRRLSWSSASFAILADIAMGTLGGQLKAREKLTGRFADILSNMYIGTAILRRYIAEGSKREDLPFVHYSMNHCLYEIEKAFDGILGNLKVPGLTWLFSGPIRAWSAFNSLGGESSDVHSHKIASLILSDTEQRQRITEGIYLPRNTVEQLGKLEAAFHAVKKAEPVERKVRKALYEKKIPKLKGEAAAKAAMEKGIISRDELELMTIADDLRWQAIQVDDFSQEEYLARKAKGSLQNAKTAGASQPSQLLKGVRA